MHVALPSHNQLTAPNDKKADQRVQAATCNILLHVRTVCVGVFSCGLFFVIY